MSGTDSFDHVAGFLVELGHLQSSKEQNCKLARERRGGGREQGCFASANENM